MFIGVHVCIWGLLSGSAVENLHLQCKDVQEMHVQSLDWEDAVEEETANPLQYSLFL